MIRLIQPMYITGKCANSRCASGEDSTPILGLILDLTLIFLELDFYHFFKAARTDTVRLGVVMRTNPQPLSWSEHRTHRDRAPLFVRWLLRLVQRTELTLSKASFT
jgi:hypothetical protein